MNEKPVYTQKAPFSGNVKGRTVAFILLASVIILLLIFVNFLPYSGVLTLIVFMLGAYFIHKLLNKTVFDIKYVLYDDKLVFLRKYGRLEWEGEVFPFDEATFHEGFIEHRGRRYSFYPDSELKELLGI